MPDYLLLAGITSAALSAIFYAVYKNRQDVLLALQNAVILEIGPELVKTLLEAKDKRLPYAIITGEARPVKAKDVIKSSNVHGIRGVMKRIKIVEHKSEWSKTTRMWHDVESVLSTVATSVAFRLCTSFGFVRVMEPFSATGLELNVVYDKFEPFRESGVAKSLVEWVSGDKTKGFRTIEEVLGVGTTITGVGEVALTDDGVQLRAPANGLTYFLTRLGIDALTHQVQAKKKHWKLLSIFFACGSGVFFCISLYYYYKRKRERAENEAFISALREEGSFANGFPVEGEEGVPSCIVCMANPRNVVILNCGHVCVCRPCGDQVTNCPICRGDIVRLVPIYQS